MIDWTAWATFVALSARLLSKNGLPQRTTVVDYIRKALVAQGVAAERVHFSGRSSHFDFLGAYGEVDVALDPFPYNGGTTTSEALWQGVPVICFEGDRWAARQGVSLLRAAGLEEFAAVDLRGYVEKAVGLADCAGDLGALRAGMRGRLLGSAVCDTAGFAREMEGLYMGFLGEGAVGRGVRVGAKVDAGAIVGNAAQ